VESRLPPAEELTTVTVQSVRLDTVLATMRHRAVITAITAMDISRVEAVSTSLGLPLNHSQGVEAVDTVALNTEKALLAKVSAVAESTVVAEVAAEGLVEVEEAAVVVAA